MPRPPAWCTGRLSLCHSRVSPGLGEACTHTWQEGPQKPAAAQDLHVPSAGPPESPGLTGPHQDCSCRRPADLTLAPSPTSSVSTLVPRHLDCRTLALPSQAVTGCDKGPAEVTLELASTEETSRRGAQSRLAGGRTVGRGRAGEPRRLPCGGGQVRPSPQGAGGHAPTRPLDDVCAHPGERHAAAPTRSGCLPPCPAEFSFSAQMRGLPCSKIQDGHGETHISETFLRAKKSSSTAFLLPSRRCRSCSSSDFQ